MRRGTIKSRKLIEQLFAQGGGYSAAAFPIRIVWKPLDEGSATQTLMSVSKRHMHHAVDRNRVKRQLRECFRLNNHLLASQPLAIAFIWLSDKHHDTAVVNKKMKRLLQRITPQQ